MHDALAAQVGQGIACLARGEFAEARRLLSLAADAGVANAQNALGLIYLNGLGCPRDVKQGADRIRLAADAALPDAQYNLSGLMLSGIGVPVDPQAALSHLRAAALRQFPPALRTMGLLLSLESEVDNAPIAATCWYQAAERGDAHAGYLLARLLLSGNLGFTDSRVAQQLLSRPNVAALACAKHWAGLVQEKGAEVSEGQFVVRSLTPDRLPVPDTERLLQPPADSKRQDQANVLVSEGFFPEVACEYMMNIASPRLRASEVIDPVTGQGFRSQIRTSYAMNFQPSMHDAFIGVVRARLARFTGCRPEEAEPAAVLRYEVGQEYKPHFDFIPRFKGGTTQELSTPSEQRRFTCLWYLNTPAAGGETDFPRLGFRIPAICGSVIAFNNCNAAGEPDDLTLHAGMPVTEGEKWVASFWFQDRPYVW